MQYEDIRLIAGVAFVAAMLLGVSGMFLEYLAKGLNWE